ncbi:polyketide synthase dehydratase domain-containing protein, partial [Streptantibioticus ferralitis]
AEGLRYAAPRIPVVSNLTGGVVSAEEIGSADFWVRHVREAVRFLDGVRALEAAGVRTFVELGPDGVLSAMAQDCVTSEGATFVPVLRGGRPEAETLTAALAGAYVRGVPVDWQAYFAGSGARRMELPTYPFQREWYWLNSAAPQAGPGDAAGLGLGATDHPLLGAAVELPDAEGFLFTGRLSLDTHPWLADHAVMDAVLLPGTAFVEMALRAGEQAGCEHIEELTLEAPLILPERGGVQLRLSLGAADESGRRSLTLHSRSEQASADEPWLRHATGALGERESEASFDFGVWPPQDAEAVTVDGLYEGLAAAGFAYGPVFQGLRAAWRRGDEVFAEVGLPEGAEEDAFGLHPALLDAVLHGIGLGELVEDTGQGRLPFSWSGVSLYAVGAATVRVRLASAGRDAVALEIADSAGAPVASVDALALRSVSPERLGGGRGVPADSLFRVEWTPVTVTQGAEPDGGWTVIGAGDLAELDSVPGTVVVDGLTSAATGSAEDVHGAVHRALELVQSWLADERFADARLVFVTHGVADLAGSAMRGLVRSAQSENPGRFALVDVDGAEVSRELLAAAVASGEPEVAVRGDRVEVPRLARAVADGEESSFAEDG